MGPKLGVAKLQLSWRPFKNITNDNLEIEKNQD
jgi:hypothetical protein